MQEKQNQFSRRDFMKTSAALSWGTMGLLGARAFAAGSDTLRIGLIGCGGRGTGAVVNCLYRQCLEMGLGHEGLPIGFEPGQL